MKFTTKELGALEEQLNAEQLLISKYADLAEQTSDTVIKTQFSQISQKHRQHFDTLSKFLKS